MPSMKPTGPTYWRSLDELEQTPEFRAAVKREFPDDEWDRLPPATRRQFVKVMGASMALAGLTACRWPKEEIVPFARRPDGRVPGVPQNFATAMELGGAALGMVVTSYDGRPVKAEGNPLHPDSLGALSAIAQAEVLQLYDPDRSRRLVLRDGGGQFVKKWRDFEAVAADRVAGGGAGVAVLAGASSSPTRSRLRDALLASLPEIRWFEYEAVSRDTEREGLRLVFGARLRSHLHLDRCAVVACFDADPIFDHPASLGYARALAAARNPESGAGARLYVAEPSFTLTGVRADERTAVAASQVPAVLAGLAHRLVAEHGVELPPSAAGFAGAAAPEGSNAEGFIRDLAADLVRHRGSGLIVVGPRQAPAVHALAAVLNRALDAVGTTLEYSEDPSPDRPPHAEAIFELASAIRDGEVETLVILGGNPAFDAPADLGFADLLEQVPVTAHLSLYDDETSRRCTWHLPASHFLEAWGDGTAWDGTLTLRQPLIEPLYGGRSEIEVLALLAGVRPASGRDLVRGTMVRDHGGSDFEDFWQRALHDEMVPGTASPRVAPSIDPSSLAAAVAALRAALEVEPPAGDRFELVLAHDPCLYDGRYANNGWLQELPDALTKITWDNALLMSPSTARQLSVTDGAVIEVAVGGRTVELPACVIPGPASNVVVTTFGYGRTAAGGVGNGVGVDTCALRTAAQMSVLRPATLRATGRRAPLASTQDHFAIDTLGFGARTERADILVREATVEAYRANPDVIHEHDHHPPNINLWPDHVYQGEQWGMAIDLNTCIGCNACVVACQAENNIPVVGKEQVLNQREMQWIRIDRYFKTERGATAAELDRADVVFQPLTCVHCENAPCEQVCPVAATQHTADGLNAMVYNRCVGTRYCSNNCPYKVRRFNFFNYQKDLHQIEMMQHNPEVTVRSRGVMEKCTFCIQRIEAVRIPARNQNRPIADGEIVPACAQTCPARAIVFGNLNDPDSEVSRLHREQRAYETLSELNIRARTLYLARLNDPVDGGAPSHSSGSHDDDGHGKESA